MVICKRTGCIPSLRRVILEMSTRQALEIYFWGFMMYSIEQIGDYMHEDIVDPKETETYKKLAPIMRSDLICSWGMEASASIPDFLQNLDVLKVDHDQLHSDIWAWGIQYLTQIAEHASNIAPNVPKEEIVYQTYCQWYMRILKRLKSLMDSVSHIEDLLYSGGEDIRPTLVEKITALENIDYFQDTFIEELIMQWENLLVQRVSHMVIVVLFK